MKWTWKADDKNAYMTCKMSDVKASPLKTVAHWQCDKWLTSVQQQGQWLDTPSLGQNHSWTRYQQDCVSSDFHCDNTPTVYHNANERITMSNCQTAKLQEKNYKKIVTLCNLPVQGIITPSTRCKFFLNFYKPTELERPAGLDSSAALQLFQILGTNVTFKPIPQKF